MLIPDRNFIKLGELPLEVLQPAIDKCVQFDWMPDRYNQPPTSGALAGGKTLEYPFVSQHPATRDRSYTAEELSVLNSTLPIFKWIKEFVNEPIILIRCELSTMLPKSGIQWHIDSNHKFFPYCKRVHVPITSNPGCKQSWEGEDTRFEVGSIYEYNNQVKHTASNHGDTPRTTMILDFVTEDRWNELTEKSVFNKALKSRGLTRFFI